MPSFLLSSDGGPLGTRSGATEGRVSVSRKRGASLRRGRGLKLVRYLSQQLHRRVIWVPSRAVPRLSALLAAQSQRHLSQQGTTECVFGPAVLAEDREMLTGRGREPGQVLHAAARGRKRAASPDMPPRSHTRSPVDVNPLTKCGVAGWRVADRRPLKSPLQTRCTQCRQKIIRR